MTLPPARPAVEWLTLKDAETARQALTTLGEWVDDVWAHYDPHLRTCWMYHPSVVAQLLAVKAAWAAAIRPDAKPTQLADWFDRYQVPVERRIWRLIDCQPGSPIHEVKSKSGVVSHWVLYDVDLVTLAKWWVATHGEANQLAPGLKEAK